MTKYNVIIEAPALGSTFTVEAGDALEALAKAERANPGWTAKLATLIPEGFTVPAKQTYSVGLDVPAPGSCRLVLASSAEEAIAIVNRDRPGLATGARPLFSPSGRVSADAMREARLEELLEHAEGFLAGFEGDELQTGVDELLEAIRLELANDGTPAAEREGASVN